MVCGVKWPVDPVVSGPRAHLLHYDGIPWSDAVFCRDFTPVDQAFHKPPDSGAIWTFVGRKGKPLPSFEEDPVPLTPQEAPNITDFPPSDQLAFLRNSVMSGPGKGQIMKGIEDLPGGLDFYQLSDGSTWEILSKRGHRQTYDLGRSLWWLCKNRRKRGCGGEPGWQ